MTSINEFISVLKSDQLLSPNRFRVSIFGKGNDVPAASPEVMLMCAQIMIPGLTITPTADRRVGIGSTQFFPDGRELTQITAGFYESQSHKERKYFSEWIDKIYDKTTRRFNFHENITKIIKIEQLTKDDRVCYECFLYDAWPTHISDLSRAYAAIDTVEMMTVSFVYNELREQFYDEQGAIVPADIIR